MAAAPAVGPGSYFPRARCDDSETRVSSRNTDTSDGEECSEYTCSLFSTRMPTNQTCDDLPGPGRLIDTYIYLPAGRLVERAINRFVVQMNTKWIDSEISGARDIIVGFHDSIRLQCHGESSVRHRYWRGVQIMTETVPLSALLYFWGAQNLEVAEDDVVVKQCRHIASFARSPHPAAQKAGLKCITRLLDRYPRLRFHFDLSAIHSCALAANHHQLFEDVFWILSDYQCERSGFDDLFRGLSEGLPGTEVSDSNIGLCRGPLLNFVAESLLSLKTSRAEGGIFHLEFKNFLEQLLQVESMFKFQGLQYRQDDPLERFWVRLADLWGEVQLNSRLLTKRMAVLLRQGLINTWESLALNPATAQTAHIGDFAEMSLSLFERLDSWSGMVKASYSVSDKSELVHLVERKLLVIK